MKVAIFDMDGVLVDSECIHRDAFKKVFTELNIPVTEKEQDGFAGLPSDKIWGYIREKYSIRQSVSDLIKMKRKVYSESLKSTQIKPTDGLIELLDTLKENNIKICIASSSAREFVRYIIDRLEITHYFDNIVSGEDVVNGKPNPDIYLKASEKYNVIPSDCTVIEDAHNGVIGAKAAGMNCVGYKNPNSGNQDLSKADIIVDSFNSDSIDKILKLVKNS